MENKYLKKFLPEEWINEDILESEYQGNIDIYEDEISFSNLEFDSRFLVEENFFSCSKDIIEQIIFKCIAKNKNNSTYPVKVSDIKTYIFYGCKFNNDVYFNLPNNCNIELKSCSFEKNFYINKDMDYQKDTNRIIDINELIIDNCVFKSEFFLKSCIVKEYQIINIVFEDNVKLIDIKIIGIFKNIEKENEAWFTNTIFNKSVIFEHIIFNNFIQFKYTIFKGYTLFRDIEFKEGLDLDYTNIENKINFYNLQGLNTKESIKKTSIETYRIIKYNFEQISNHIEANKYYMLEMTKYQDSIKCKSFWENMVFIFNNGVSSFGQSWIRPFIIYLVIGFIFTLFISNFTIDECFYNLLTDVYNPLDKSIIEKFNIIGLIYKVFSGLILYHLIISLKRQTKR